MDDANWVPDGGRGLWDKRMVGYDPEVVADQLMAHPYNARIHPPKQQKAMEQVLEKVGWIQNVIVSKNSGCILDGHMRAYIAMDRGETVPVVYVDLTEEQEALVLATYDPLSGMALFDTSMYEELTSDLMDVGDELQALIDRTAKTVKSLPDEERDEGGLDTQVFQYGFASWGTTKIEITQDDVTRLDEARSEYVATNGDTEGFVEWLLQE